MNVKKMSGNDLFELRCLIGDIQVRMRNYSHVSDYLPKSITTTLDKISEKINEEFEDRQDDWCSEYRATHLYNNI
jgi:hypothetical protein